MSTPPDNNTTAQDRASGIRTGIALSGGVDSAVAAALLIEAGHRVEGFFLRLPVAHAAADEAAARRVAEQLGITLTVIEAEEAFLREVVDPFTNLYRKGMTPNPCVRCNQRIKLGLLARAMREAGMERIATGHYARLYGLDGLHGLHDHPVIARAADPTRDQSYFLARVDPGLLPRLLLPLGEWTKTQVREQARALNLPHVERESQDVCFLDRPLADFLRAQGLADHPGPICDTTGHTIGEHRGLWRYTIGQRRGLGLPDATPWYVAALDVASNRLVVGKRDELLRAGCTVQEPHWMVPPPALPLQALVQLRSRHTPSPATLHADGRLLFSHPQRAVTPGQFAVFYQDDRVIGSAVIAADHNPAATTSP
ncbi:MAG: tRNA 2-thiouridine(34) synthase MnmA [Desulfobulbus sp.]